MNEDLTNPIAIDKYLDSTNFSDFIDSTSILTIKHSKITGQPSKHPIQGVSIIQNKSTKYIYIVTSRPILGRLIAVALTKGPVEINIKVLNQKQDPVLEINLIDIQNVKYEARGCSQRVACEIYIYGKINYSVNTEAGNFAINFK